MKKIEENLNSLKSVIAKIKADTELIEECLQTSPDDPNRPNVCVAPEGETADRSDKDTADDVIWAASMYLNTGDRCSPQVSARQSLKGILLIIMIDIHQRTHTPTPQRNRLRCYDSYLISKISIDKHKKLDVCQIII